MAHESIIRAASGEELERFFAYLDEHLSDNGSGATALFMPMARAASRFGPERSSAFRSACASPLGQAGWRRLWLAFDAQGAIMGHIDLRARPEGAAAHRALLGMGVRRDARKQGLGARLIEAAARWAADEAHLDWIDLEVLSLNLAARQLYARCGFVQTGETADMFRIDGESLGYTFMSRRLGNF
jgi:RimJ/RimL family protein N-acetyltransferase